MVAAAIELSRLLLSQSAFRLGAGSDRRIGFPISDPDPNPESRS